MSKPGTPRGEKPSKVAGITRAALRSAEDELEAFSVAPTAHVDIDNTFAALLDAWQKLEHQRESNRMDYQRLSELNKKGREVDKDGIVQAFAQAKQEIEVVEEQIFALFKDEEESDIRRLIRGRHFVPGTGIIWGVPDSLKRIVAQETGMTGIGLDVEEDEESSQDIPATASEKAGTKA
jgi:hypothetical protein